MITIDGYTWPVPCDIRREAQVTPSEISGMMLDKSYFNDVIGTFMRYDVTLAVPPTMEEEFAALYESLTAPVDGHAFVMPYGMSTLQITGRVENVRDSMVYTVSQKQYWKGVQFTVVANHPTKTETLGTVVTRGRSPLPEAASIPVGTVLEMTSSGWDTVEDADGKYY